MSHVIRLGRAEADPDMDRFDDSMAALIKGMILRGDRQSDIAACFLINGGRISEINTGRRFRSVQPAPQDELPPRAPYPAPYALWRARREMLRAHTSLENAQLLVETAIGAVRGVGPR